MFFRQIKVGHMDNFNYIIADEKKKIAAVIDPAWEEDKLLNIAREHGFEIKHILLTHTHYDHIDAVARLAAKTNAMVYVHENEKSAIANLGVNIITVKDADMIKIGDITVKVIFTPGHTAGGITYNIGDKLFTGDTLFIGSIGRTDLEGGDPKVLFESLQKLKSLPEDYEIFPGHDYGDSTYSTIAEQKIKNPYFKCVELSEFLEKI